MADRDHCAKGEGVVSDMVSETRKASRSWIVQPSPLPR